MNCHCELYVQSHVNKTYRGFPRLLKTFHPPTPTHYGAKIENEPVLPSPPVPPDDITLMADMTQQPITGLRSQVPACTARDH